MRRRLALSLRALILSMAAAGLGGCQAEADLSGVYQLMEHSLDPEGCDGGREVDSSPYFMVLPQGTADARYLAVQPCPDASGESCLTLGLLGDYELSTAEGDRWSGERSSAALVEDGCRLQRVETSASRQGGSLQIEVRTLESRVPAGSGCTASDALGAGLSCRSRERLVGRRVGDVPVRRQMTGFF